ncbi:hypothetical protein HAX54_019442, partial [Datura stramonium]|nr:hypothetical protein [Datura stramonium]
LSILKFSGEHGWKNLGKVAIFLCFIAVSTGRELKVKAKSKHHAAIYNHTLATILVEYASAVYVDLTGCFTWTCSRCNDLTKGFQILELIVDVQRCLQAFVGVAQDLECPLLLHSGALRKAVLSKRSTKSSKVSCGLSVVNIFDIKFNFELFGYNLQEWIEDLYWKQLDISYPGMEGAMVHHSFILLTTTLTGHSNGEGAMAAFWPGSHRASWIPEYLGYDIWAQPRMGNAAFVSYYSERVPNTIRVTNVYTVEKVCDNSGRDPSCSRSVSGNSITDHLRYFGVKLSCDVSAGCRIVMDNGLAAYRTADSGQISSSPEIYLLLF